MCLFVHSGVKYILCSHFALFVFVLYLVYPMLPVSLHCPFLIAASIVYNVYTTIFQLYHRDVFVEKTGYIQSHNINDDTCIHCLHICIICMCKTYYYKINGYSSKLCMRLLIVICSLIRSFLKELSPFLLHFQWDYRLYFRIM